MAGIAPAHVLAAAMAVLGLGLIAAAFAAAEPAPIRLFAGLGLLVAALVTSGLRMLLRNAGNHREAA